MKRTSPTTTAPVTTTEIDREQTIDELLEQVGGGATVNCFLPVIPGRCYLPGAKGTVGPNGAR